MNKREAIRAVLNGLKVTLDGWTGDQYIVMSDSLEFVDEYGDWIDFNDYPEKGGWKLYKPAPEYEWQWTYKYKSVDRDGNECEEYLLTAGHYSSLEQMGVCKNSEDRQKFEPSKREVQGD